MILHNARIDFSYQELADLADKFMQKYKRNWLQGYIRFLGIIPIINSDRDDEIVTIVSFRSKDRMKAWRLRRLFDEYRSRNS